MAAERQQQRPAQPQPDGRQNQPQGQQQSGQSSQAVQRRGGGPQSALARRGQFMPSLFSMDPFDMLRTSPFALMRHLTEEMDRYFANLGMGRGGQGMAAAGSEFFAPPVEVLERDGKLIVRADLPGLTKDDVRVEITNDALTIEGERRSEHEERQEGEYCARSATTACSADRFRYRKESMRTRRQPISRMGSWRSRCQRRHGRRVAAR